MTQQVVKSSLKFMVAVSEPEVRDQLAKFLAERFIDSKVYLAKDGIETLQRLAFDLPHVLIIDSGIASRSVEQVVTEIYSNPKQQEIQTVVISDTGKHEGFEDFKVSGKLQIVLGSAGMDPLVAALYKAINRTNPENKEFILKYLQKGEVLLNEGEVGDRLYILKKGSLTAFLGTIDAPKVLGQIKPGEFVGEMAYINGEPRAATVIADEDCELVEFKTEAFERIVFQKPSWMKIMLQTLSRRIKKLNVFKSAR